MRAEELTAEQVEIMERAVDWTTRHLRGPGRDDLSQDIWVILLRKLSDYDPTRGAIGTWAAMVAQYALLDRLRDEGSRRAKRRGPRPHPLPVDYREMPIVVDPAPGPLAQAEGRDLLESLAVSRRDVVVLNLLSEGLSQEAAGRAVGLSGSRVSQLVGSYRRKLASIKARERQVADV